MTVILDGPVIASSPAIRTAWAPRSAISAPALTPATLAPIGNAPGMPIAAAPVAIAPAVFGAVTPGRTRWIPCPTFSTPRSMAPPVALAAVSIPPAIFVVAPNPLPATPVAFAPGPMNGTASVGSRTMLAASAAFGANVPSGNPIMLLPWALSAFILSIACI